MVLSVTLVVFRDLGLTVSGRILIVWTWRLVSVLIRRW